MKKDFKEAYTGIMNDADSYEFVSFQIFQKSSEFSEKNEWHLMNYKTVIGHENDDFSEVFDSLSKIEIQNNSKWMYTGALVKIRGKNSFGAKVVSEHVAYYSDLPSNLGGGLIEIDGYMVSGNMIMRSLRKN